MLMLACLNQLLLSRLCSEIQRGYQGQTLLLCWLFAVSHLKRPEGKGHEDGAATSVSQLRGSASIAQLSDFVIGLERNGQAEDETERCTTHMRVLKNRFSGITGPAGSLLYDTTTGRLHEYEPQDYEEVL